MAMTLTELQDVVKKGGLKFFVDPERPKLMFGAAGLNGSYQCIISLEVDGQFLQIRSLNFLACPADHPHLLTILKIIGEINFQKRLVKIGWDPSDGEIMVYADLWLMDNKLTQQQWDRMLENYLPAVDFAYRRLKQTLDTGQDPGEEKPEDVIDRLLGGSSLPPALRDLVGKLKKKLAGETGAGEEEDITSL